MTTYGHNPQGMLLVKAISESPWGSEFIRELENAKTQSLGGELSAQEMEKCASTVAMRHAAELLQAQAINEGRAVDASRLSPAYVAQLNDPRRRVTSDTITEFARRLHPDLTPAQALAAWTEKAAKMGNVDITTGDDYEPKGPYVPGRSTARESSD